ncbi:MAG: BMP family protein [Vulcanimicrobiaceae bacterium]
MSPLRTSHGRATLAACLALGTAACSAQSKAPATAAPRATASASTAAEGETRVPGPGTPLRVGLVLATGDAPLNDAATAGLLAVKRRLGAEVEVLRPTSSAQYQPDLTLLANQDYDEIFAVGPSMQRDLGAVAKIFPRRRFAIVDANVDLVNVTSLTFRAQDGAFLAGALAALVSKRKAVAFLGGTDVPALRAYEAGFVTGAREIDPAIAVTTQYVGSVERVESTRVASALFDRGADVVFAADGSVAQGTLDAAQAHRGAYVIDVDDRHGASPASRLVTSVVKRADVAVFRTALQAQAQKLPAGPVAFGLGDGSVGLIDFRQTQQLVGARNLATLARIRAAIVAGRIVVPATREALPAFKPVVL